MQKRIAVLGSTGSVGTNALRIIADQPDRFDVVLLTAHSSRAALCEQIARFRPDAACLAGDAGAGRPAELASNAGWSSGTADGILEMLEATSPDLVLNAITGAAGLRGSEWTLGNGKTLALANKESLVMAGGYLMDLATESGARILPVDSEHCAIFQCLEGSNQRGVRRIYLTASGGPFLDRAPETMTEITPDEALDHPTWDMGPRITIGSATMMNKAFEVLEAHWLFGLEPEQIEVVIHPQSIVHSMVEFVDGSMLAQLGLPDMRVPINYCLAYPERIPFEFAPFDPVRFRELNFLPVDSERYPAVPLAFETLAKGGDSGAVLNAADEVLTGMFLDGKVDFPTITRTVARVVREHVTSRIHSVDDVIRADRRARAAALAAANGANPEVS